MKWGKITAAFVAAVLLVAVCGWVGGQIYHVDYLAKPAYKIGENSQTNTVDLAALRRQWPQALSTKDDQTKLLGMMRNISLAVVPKPAGGEVAAAPAPAAPPPIDLPTRLAMADLDKGKASFAKCQACHSFAKGDGARIGPNLYGVVGRQVATFPGFDYSDGMKKKGGTWTFDDLDTFLSKPMSVVPGTKMTFIGLPEQQERANVIDYLHTLSDSPLPLPPKT